ncbi:MAG: multidrug transporter [Actinomycetota bacterium]
MEWFNVLLLIGGWYWHLKVTQIEHGRDIQSQLDILARIRLIAAVVLSVSTFAFAASWVVAVGKTADRGWATAFLILAWAEYVNHYFYYQLMHDTRSDLERLMRTRKLRKSWLATDLDGSGQDGV